MIKADFRTRYEYFTHVKFDWDRFVSDAAFTLKLVKMPASKFGQIYTPWYVDKNESAATWNTENSRAISIREAVKRQDQFHLNQEALATWASRIARGVELGPLPSYSVGRGRHVLLDGNHRMLAAAMSGLPLSVQLISVVGPIDESVFSDLRYWSRLSRRP